MTYRYLRLETEVPLAQRSKVALAFFKDNQYDYLKFQLLSNQASWSHISEMSRYTVMSWNKIYKHVPLNEYGYM